MDPESRAESAEATSARDTGPPRGVLDTLRELFPIIGLPLLWKVEAQLWRHYLLRFLPLDIWLQGRKLDRPFSDFRFGETPWFTGRRLLEWARVGPDDVFFDLGCGRGKMVFLAALDRGCRSVGVEILPGYVRIGQQIAAATHLDRASFFCQDFSEVDLREATVVFVAGSIFSDSTKRLLEVLVDQLKSGAQWLSVSWPTSHPRLELKASEDFFFSWGRETVYRYRVNA
jgi:SAM-dependent methyltransferase